MPQYQPSDSQTVSRTLCPSIVHTHTSMHTHYCVWLTQCLLAAAEDWVASLLSHSTHQWKTIIKIGSSGSKLAVP